MKRLSFLCLLCLVCAVSGQLHAARISPEHTLRTTINTYLRNYLYEGFEERAQVSQLTLDDKKQTLTVNITEPFACQQFTPAKIDTIRRSILSLLPAAYRDYRLLLYCNDYPIEEYLLGGADDSPLQRTWGNIRYKGNDWVTPLSRPYTITRGLQHRHLSVCASHGSIYDLHKQQWRWQRPYLFCTTEDLLTQTLVVPYLIPMLERAGAIIYSVRERDWQTASSVVDNDTPTLQGTYAEHTGTYSWEPADTGFALKQAILVDGDNPFRMGTSRKVAAQTRKSQTAQAVWTPQFTAPGRYAVYVSYTTLPNSVSDAHYTVRHRGINTHFQVNQRMGGGTWVYLGTFDFAADDPANNNVTLTNRSNTRGYVTADAVRFGGGMGNYSRGDSLAISGLPRYLEGARYAAAWAGMPQYVYGNKDFTDDYKEDINVRSLATNYLARGSVFLPGDSGLHVPLEASIGIHSDAGCRSYPEIIGSLAICTTHSYDGIYPSGLTRLTARDLCERTLDQVYNDLSATFGIWRRRQIYDRNYSESREPQIPGIILETLSHQNFYDLCMMHDPAFKFTLSRAIYKALLRYISAMHGEKNPVVQPLPVQRASAICDFAEREITLRWVATTDPLEPTAEAKAFIVYHAEGTGDFDNGTSVNATTYLLPHPTPNTLHRFLITAVNEGGESLPSTELCAYLSTQGEQQLLLVDAFSRLAGPQPIDNDSTQGFDLENEPGVPIARMPGYCGRQQGWDKSRIGREGPGALGYSGQELEGMLLAGNTLDWSTRHARDILAVQPHFSISSTTSEALADDPFDTRAFQIIDIIGGLQKADGYSLRQQRLFTPALVQHLAAFVRNGGNILLSGAFVGSDMTSDEDRLVTRSLLKYETAGALHTDTTLRVSGLIPTPQSAGFAFSTTFNETRYRVASADILLPVAPAFCSAVYTPDSQSAAVAYDGKDYKAITLGFPIESVSDDTLRRNLWNTLLHFLCP